MGYCLVGASLVPSVSLVPVFIACMLRLVSPFNRTTGPCLRVGQATSASFDNVWTACDANLACSGVYYNPTTAQYEQRTGAADVGDPNGVSYLKTCMVDSRTNGNTNVRAVAFCPLDYRWLATAGVDGLTVYYRSRVNFQVQYHSDACVCHHTCVNAYACFCACAYYHVVVESAVHMVHATCLISRPLSSSSL